MNDLELGDQGYGPDFVTNWRFYQATFLFSVLSF